MTRSIGIVDYGSGNLFSVMRGLEAADCRARLLCEPENWAQYDGLLLPGVGAFGAGMELMRAKALDKATISFAKTGKPILGVCLGMQFLMTRSYEFGCHSGLNLIEGDVVPISPAPGWPVPNIGWNKVHLCRSARGTPFCSIASDSTFYFVHSYQCKATNPADMLGTISYANTLVAAIISRENVHGCQFHPEISGPVGISIYRAFQNPD